MTYDLEAINTLYAQIAECMHRNPARAMRLLGQAKANVREALERAANGQAVRLAAPQASAPAPSLPKGWQLAMNLCIDAIENAPPQGEEWPVNWPAIRLGLVQLRDALLGGAAPEASADIEIQAKLTDPNVVHVNMLRGTIAPITFDQLAHVLGDEATAKWISDRQQRGGDVGVCVVNCGDHYSVEFMSGGVIRKFPHEDYAFASYFAQGYRAALSAQPAASAEPEKDHFKPPFDNCSFRLCDLPGQCRGEGKCHHPASAPALAAHKPDGGDAKDAERYRGWRDAAVTNSTPFVRAMRDALPLEAREGRPRWPTPAEWDAAIDAAISAQQRQGEGEQ